MYDFLNLKTLKNNILGRNILYGIFTIIKLVHIVNYYFLPKWNFKFLRILHQQYKQCKYMQYII